MIDYNKKDWIDMKQKVKWGNNTYDLYRSPDNLYDILYIEGVFTINPSESKTLYHDKNSEYVYITVSQPINV